LVADVVGAVFAGEPFEVAPREAGREVVPLARVRAEGAAQGRAAAGVEVHVEIAHCGGLGLGRGVLQIVLL
jgi:hypothetical protein